jgi:hypothetical protein
MKDIRLQRLHLTPGGQFLGWTASHEEVCFDLVAEVRAEPGTEAKEIFARHLADGGMVSVDVYGQQSFAVHIKPKERKMLEARAIELHGSDDVNFDRVMKAQWSAATPNRSGIVVPNEAWDLEAFNGSNPIGAWNHRTSFSGPEMIISRWLFTGHKNSRPSSNLIGFAEMVPHDINPLATTVFGLYQFGAMNTFSPGFLVGKVDFQDEGPVILGTADDPNELVELSFVPVPRHADAVRLAVDDGAVELKPLRDLITVQMAMAYEDPMQAVEFALLEALAKKLDLVNAGAMVDLGADGIEALELPGGEEGAGSTLVSDKEIAHTLRSAEGDCPEGLDSESWDRFAAATNDGDSDETLLIAARAAGLVKEANGLERIIALEAKSAASLIEEPIPEGNSDDGDQDPKPQVFTLDDLHLDDAFSSLRADAERLTGRLIIPD